RSNHTQIGETPALYMWVTYRVLAQDGAWPLPHLADLRNIYWDRHSVRLLNGEPMNVDADAWLPESVPAQGNVIPQVRRIDFPNGNSVLVSPASTNSPAFPANLHLAVVVDRSRSMAEYAGNVKTTLDRLATLSSNVDVYLTASEYRGEAPSRSPLAQFDPTGLVYYGGQNAAELLAQFDQLHAGEVYDAILVLTDGTGYKLNSDNLKVPIPDAPVWMLHLDGALSLGYDDATLEAIQASGGGVVGALEDALVRIAVGNAAGTGETAFSDLIDGYEWTTLPTTEITTEAGVQLPPTDPFAAFAARRLILAEMYRQRDTLDQLSNLDYLHALALEHSIVTPYSSMIVLINTQQEKLLDELEAAEDRFLREHEDVGETVSDPISVTGVPEPEEWLLIIMATGLLAWYTLRKRYAKL
ncbi:MAG: TIGR02921 family PEP-CTERM protein, partial [Anaerolineae bacterium]|nr:TIGR02921 family PEP-CTERM protein [Anaerolineae bacterium]